MSETKYYSKLFERVDDNEFCRLFETSCKCGTEHLYSVKEEQDGLKTYVFFICPECGRKCFWKIHYRSLSWLGKNRETDI